MKKIKILVQSEASPRVLVEDFERTVTVGEVLVRLGVGKDDAAAQLVFVEDRDEPVGHDVLVGDLLAMVEQKESADDQVLRIHRGRCRRVAVSVTFNNVTETRHFPPVTRVARVHRWATHTAFHMSPRDAAEHVLELVGSDERPDPDTQIGALTSGPVCAVAFDLVPFQRVEG